MGRKERCVPLDNPTVAVIIALWLGHESLDTTQIYLEATLPMKEQALSKAKPLNGKFKRYRPGDHLLGFLNNL